MLKRLLLLYIALILSFSAFAKPARPGRIFLSQPDGSGFYALFQGDEHMRVKMTEGGNAIVQDEDGWWCYAVYDADGHKISTGCRVGGNVPADILMKSCEIPLQVLASRVSERRSYVKEAELAERGILSRIRRRTLTRSETPSVKHGIVILVQFKGENEKFKYTREDFINMLTQEGYSSFGATGCAKEYFNDQFGGQYDFDFHVTDIVTLDKEMAYYGKNNEDDQDENPHMMVVEACQLADEEVDFAKYDQDGDGEVDNVFLFFAGEDEAEGASEDHVWSHAWYIKDGAGRNLVLDGVRINRYACASELRTLGGTETSLAAIGTYCHEYSHTFGLPDLYDTDYQSGGYAAATWRRLSLMDGGNYNNNGNTPPNYTAIERDLLMMTEPEVLVESGEYSLNPINEGRYFRVDSDNEGEYFLLECRTAKGWDTYIGGEGLLVYHIDKSQNPAGYSEIYEKDVTAFQRWGGSNEVNALASHQCADLVEADSRPDSFSNIYDSAYQNYLMSTSGLFFPNLSATAITPVSTPGFRCWGDAKVSQAITGISYQDGKVTFNLSGFSEGSLPVPSSIGADIFQDAAIIRFSSSYPFEGKAQVVCKHSDETVHTVEVSSYEPGKWACLLDSLDYSTSYTVHINFSDGDYISETSSFSFMTKRKQSMAYPYIYLGNVRRADDGRFPAGSKLPLRLFNARDAKEIRWSFNDEPITVGEDCYYEIRYAGTLRAYVVWEDGSEEIIIKEINLEEVYED